MITIRLYGTPSIYRLKTLGLMSEKGRGIKKSLWNGTYTIFCQTCAITEIHDQGLATPEFIRTLVMRMISIGSMKDPIFVVIQDGDKRYKYKTFESLMESGIGFVPREVLNAN